MQNEAHGNNGACLIPCSGRHKILGRSNFSWIC